MSFIRKIKVKGHVYLIEVKSVWENGRPKQKFVRYLGKLEGNKLIPPKVERLRVKSVFSFGLQLVFNKVVNDIDLDDIIDKKVLALVALNLIEPGSINRFIKNFYKFGIDRIFDLKMDKSIYSELDFSSDFIFEKELEIYERFKKSIGKIFYDITNVYFYGARCYLAKKGYDPKTFLPSIKVGLVIDDSGFPLFHRIFPGNISSYKTLEFIINCLKLAKIKDCMLVLDRGFFSKENIKLAEKNGYSLIISVPLKGRLKKIKPNLNWKLIRLKSTYIYVKKLNDFLICYNEPEAIRMKKTVILKGSKPKQYGIYALYSTKKLDIDNIVRVYFEKDLIERSFRCLKTVLGLGPLYSWIENKINLHLFVCFISYLILNYILLKTKKLNLSIEKILDELKCIHRVELEGGIIKYSTLSKNQERILKCFRIKL